MTRKPSLSGCLPIGYPLTPAVPMPRTGLGQATFASKCLFLLVFALAGCSSFTADKAVVMKMDLDMVCEGEGKFRCHLKGGRATEDSTNEKGQDVKVPTGILP